MAGKRYVWRTSRNPAEDEKCKRFPVSARFADVW